VGGTIGVILLDSSTTTICCLLTGRASPGIRILPGDMPSDGDILFVPEGSGPFAVTTWEDSKYAGGPVWETNGAGGGGGGGLDFSLAAFATRAANSAATSIAPGPVFYQQWEDKTNIQHTSHKNNPGQWWNKMFQTTILRHTEGNTE
jgi:hypothetical protein